MGHEHRNRHRFEHRARDPAKDPFKRSCMTVSTEHQQIGLATLAMNRRAMLARKILSSDSSVDAVDAPQISFTSAI